MNATSARAVVRIARRNIGRSRWRSLLISLLVMLPVAAMLGAATIVQTVTPTPGRSVTHQMGEADLLVYPAGSGATSDALRGALPAGSRVEPFSFADGRLVLPGMEASVSLRSMDLGGLAKGMLTIVDGRPPRNPGEVAISASVASLAAVGIGDSITLKGLGSPTVVGLVEDQFDLKARVVLQDVSAAAAAAQGQTNWLVGLPPGTDVASLDLGTDIAGPSSALFQSTSRGAATMTNAGPTPAIILLGGLALLEAALVASAAFAVSIRRRQRELGLLAATGAEPRHLAGTVMAEGALLGGLGVLAGVIVSLGGALAVSPWLDQLTDRRNPPIGVSPPWILVAGGIGLFAALMAAFVPAWTAARLPVLTALSGRRPGPAPARRTLSLGIVMIGIAIALTSSGAAMRLRDQGSMSSLLLLAGAILGTLGFGACSPWLLERLEKPAARLPLASRIALRDTARARSRNGPIVTALLASFAVTVALAAYSASQDATTAARWRPWLLPDQIFMQGEGVAHGGPEAARELGAIAAGPILGAGSADRSVWISPGDSHDPNLGIQNVTVGDGELLKALGAESATSDLLGGAVVFLAEKPTDVARVTVHVMDNQGAEVDSLTLPARVAVIGIDPHAGLAQMELGDLPGAVLSAETATRLGVSAGSSDRYVIRLGHPVTDADLARAATIAAQYPDTYADASRGPSRPGEAFRMAMLIASLLFALSVTGLAVALGEAESRPEQRTLLALGAEPRLRRRIAAARAGVIAVLAGALAVPAGLLPVWGLLSSRGAPLVVPLPEVVAALAVLPLLSMAGTLLFSRPIPDWSAFRNAAT
jgi:putative ABC transport system permease protein